MNSMTMALASLGMGLITCALRLSPFLLPERVTLPPWLLRSLRYVPAAVLTAIVVPELLLPQGTIDFSLGNDRLLAGLFAILVAWRTRNVFLTVVLGLITLWLLMTYNPW